MTNGEARRLLLRRPEAADMLGIGVTKLRELERSREIRSISVGRARRLPLAEIEAYIARRLAAQQPTAAGAS
jgi:excisionase family DNA binding protein